MELAPLKKEIHEKYLHAKLLDCTLRVSKSCGSKNIFMDMVTTKFLNLFTGKLKKKKDSRITTGLWEESALATLPNLLDRPWGLKS